MWTAATSSAAAIIVALIFDLSSSAGSLSCGSSVAGSIWSADARNTFQFELPSIVLNNDDYTQSVTFFACATSELQLQALVDGTPVETSDEVDIFEWVCGHDTYAFMPAIENLYRPFRSFSTLELVVSVPAPADASNETWGNENATTESRDYVLYYVCPGDDPTALLSNVEAIALDAYYTAVVGDVTEDTHYKLGLTTDLIAASPLLIDACDTPYPLTVYAVSYTNIERQAWGAVDLRLQAVAPCENGWNMQYQVELNDTQTYGDEFLFQFAVNYDHANLTTDVVDADPANIDPFAVRFRMDGRLDRVDITHCATVVSGRVAQNTLYRLDLDEVPNGEYLFSPTLINLCATPFPVDISVTSVASDAAIPVTKIGNCSHGPYSVNSLYEFYPDTTASGAQYSIAISATESVSSSPTAAYTVMFDCGELPPRNVTNPVRANITQCDEKFSGVTPDENAEVEAVYELNVDTWLASGQPQSVLQPVIIDVCDTPYPLAVDVISKRNFLAEMNDTEFIVPQTQGQPCSSENAHNYLLTFYPDATRYGSEYIIALRLPNTSVAQQAYQVSKAAPYSFSIGCDHSAFTTSVSPDSGGDTSDTSDGGKKGGLNSVSGAVWLTLFLVAVVVAIVFAGLYFRQRRQSKPESLLGGNQDDGDDAYMELIKEKDDHTL